MLDSRHSPDTTTLSSHNSPLLGPPSLQLDNLASPFTKHTVNDQLLTSNMSSKMAKDAFGGSHTAGIYADMTVDGPEIGTLVAVVDRARNLPNRKTMGKQNPYCAARLGKEAKKTDTDKRGGQTPRW